jgi:hypothetical protein
MTTESYDWSIVDILPPELAVFIFSNIPLRDIGRIAVSCKTWNNYVNEEATWKQIYELKYDTSQINNSLHQTLSWRRLFYGTRCTTKWGKKKYNKMTNTYNFTFCYFGSYDRTSFITQGGNFHAFFGRNYTIALTDLRCAYYY